MNGFSSEPGGEPVLHRFFVTPESIHETGGHRWVEITGDDAHHIQRVLRMRDGDAVEVVDGTGQEYPGTLVDVDSKVVRVRLGEPRRSRGEPAYEITLFQGLPKSDKMDWVVQKAAEIGITQVVPVTMERSVTTLNAAKAVGRVGRWQRIALSAAQQAARGRVPSICDLATLTGALHQWRTDASDGLLLVPWEEEQVLGIKAILRQDPVPKQIGIVIGPEGGLTQDEIELCRAVGGRACTLGPRILRTETAGTVVAGLILYELGEMGG